MNIISTVFSEIFIIELRVLEEAHG